MKRLDKDKEWERMLAEAEIRKSNGIAKEKIKKLENKIKREEVKKAKEARKKRNNK